MGTGGPQVGTVARYARFDDYHETMWARLEALLAFVREQCPDAHGKVYCDTGPITERDLAMRAGLGWIGKHTNLLSRRLGNWFFLGEILLDIALPPDAPETTHCGTCERCLPACPTGAITAPYQLDARRCISYLTIELKGSIPVELRPLIGNRIYGCDDCLAVCPWNKFAQAVHRRGRPPPRRPDRPGFAGPCWHWTTTPSANASATAPSGAPSGAASSATSASPSATSATRAPSPPSAAPPSPTGSRWCASMRSGHSVRYRPGVIDFPRPIRL